MNKLGDRNYALISIGVKTTGSYDPEKNFHCFEESLYMHEAEEIWEFLKWVHNTGGQFGHRNYEEVFRQFKEYKGIVTKFVNFKDWKCEVKIAKYKNNKRIALELVDAEDGMPVCMASTNLVNEDLFEGEIAIKDYSENEGVLRCLVKAGVVSEPLRIVQSGFVNIPICKLLIKQ